MRELQFIVTQQRVKKDPKCDFSGIVKNSVGYLKAKFTFDSYWDSLHSRIVEFSADDENTEAFVIDRKTNSCYIPEDVLKHDKVYLRLIGVDNRVRIETNKTYFKQEEV